MPWAVKDDPEAYTRPGAPSATSTVSHLRVQKETHVMVRPTEGRLKPRPLPSSVPGVRELTSVSLSDSSVKWDSLNLASWVPCMDETNSTWPSLIARLLWILDRQLCYNDYFENTHLFQHNRCVGEQWEQNADFMFADVGFPLGETVDAPSPTSLRRSTQNTLQISTGHLGWKHGVCVRSHTPAHLV